MAADEITGLLSQLSLPSYPSTPASSPRTTPDASPLRSPCTSTQGSAYAVFVGRCPGTYTAWVDCLAQVKGASHNSYKSYPTLAAAERAYSAAADRGLVCTSQEKAAAIARRFRREQLKVEDLALCLHFLEDSTSKAMALGSSRFYVVYVGLQPGVYLTFHECSFLTSGYKGTLHESFPKRDDAIGAMERALATGRVVKLVPL
ncbi:hypothetical protein BD626DRAFT_414217 [Schizophyllum amplum]|uniref:Ribonuclease H1 N-terminal domain-containing protein n=1 Tax=Schizophyllum amplum TaxID=97359 RepID=A0A550BUU9_9AGAR|nr:hypothetical protein BD626DRAFT_414217 [Auriculariopsis ampla]